MTTDPCRICGAATRPFGSKVGRFRQRPYHFTACERCGFVSVSDPDTDYAALYDERYYRGEGADELVDYASELERPHETVRLYELRGIVEVLRSHFGSLANKRGLDYGCGAGALVNYAVQQGVDCVGFDTCDFAQRAKARGIPIVSAAELDTMQHTFDVVTMIEVIEHVIDPVPLLRQAASLLRKGGLLFVTTGNVAPHAQNFMDWGYVRPEIHVSYFTPQSLALAYEAAGLSVIRGGYAPGWTDILRFKVLKTLRVKNRSMLEAALPWPVLSRLADWRHRNSAHPLARKPVA